jgi:hypothetical protein
MAMAILVGSTQWMARYRKLMSAMGPLGALRMV